MDSSKKIYFGIDATGKHFFLEKVANYIKMKYNALAFSGPLRHNIYIQCPIPLGNHTASINALVQEFRESFASDALIMFNLEHNAFYFDYT